MNTIENILNKARMEYVYSKNKDYRIYMYQTISFGETKYRIVFEKRIFFNFWYWIESFTFSSEKYSHEKRLLKLLNDFFTESALEKN